MDTLDQFEYAPQTTVTVDALTINLVFAGMGTKPASENDQQAIADFSGRVFAQFNSASSANPDDSETVVDRFLTSFKPILLEIAVCNF
jgi:hypothetical protein